MLGRYIYGWTGTAYDKVLIDAAGHLQVDVLSTALPTGAATETTLDLVRAELDGIEGLLAGGLPSALDTDTLKVTEQTPITGFATEVTADLIRAELDGIEGLLAAGLPSALDTDSLKIREQGTPSVHLYGVSGSTWYNLLVESSTNPNLRTKLYDGATAIASCPYATTRPVGQQLNVAAQLFAYYTSTLAYAIRCELLNTDAHSTARTGLDTWACLAGFDSSAWDRIRTYETGILKVGRAEIGAALVRKTSAGVVATGAKKLMWINIHPSDVNWLIELTDATLSGQTVVFSSGSAAKEPHHYVFDPPIEFSTAIRLETATAITAVQFSYV